MTLRTALLYLFGQADAIHRVAESKSSLWTGLALVLTAAIARSYDQVFFFERPMSFVEPILFSMGSAGFFFLFIYLVWDRCTLFDVNYDPRGMTAGELEEGLRWLFRETYSRQETARRLRSFVGQARRPPASV